LRYAGISSSPGEHYQFPILGSVCPIFSRCKPNEISTRVQTAQSDQSKSEGAEKEAASSMKTTSPDAVTAHATSMSKSMNTLLATAVVTAETNDGSQRSCRILLDCGSQINLVSRDFLNTLRLTPHSANLSISGINDTPTHSSQAVRIKLRSRLNSYSVIIDCFVADRVTDNVPARNFRKSTFDLARNFKLADPNFRIFSPIDILVGSAIFWNILCVGQIPASAKHPVMQKTRFGWVVGGAANNSSEHGQKALSLHAAVSNIELHDQLKRFWQLDEFRNNSTYTPEEQFYERHFLETVSRDHKGRYIVKLPLKEDLVGLLGSSKDIALKRLQGLEKRFNRDPLLRERYSKFINEYIALGHRKPITEHLSDETRAYYLPHHCVFKGTAEGDKIRVVFDASCKSDTGLSLNDIMMTGPVVQEDLISILTRFRTYKYVLVADIIKMYRQIRLHPTQTRLHRIFWRKDDRVEAYELVTLTYGTTAASFLATRCIKHQAEQCADAYPIGSLCVARDLYMDDMLTGADTYEDALAIRDQTIELLKEGSFELSKWGSNCLELLKGMSEQGDRLISINRGLLGPIIVVAKIILQDLWQSGIEWDESVPQDTHTRWLQLKLQLANLERLQIPRWVRAHTDRQRMEVHGFCDASQRAYGACIYIRTKTEKDSYESVLLCTKSRVAPLKALSLPRLELSAALLLAQLIHKIKASIDLREIKTCLWSDSTIALSWIASPSRKWLPFVANRVGEIQRLTERDHRRHVRSSENPADIISRGLLPDELICSEIWWHGPAFLQLPEKQWPSDEVVSLPDESPEQRKICAVARFRPATVTVSPKEMIHSLDVACKVVQRQAFASEYDSLSKNRDISKNSRILSLSPFMGENGLIRVGGRLKNSNLSFDACHQVVLPSSHDLTKRIIELEHVRNMHSGLQATMATVRQRFWPLSLRSVTRKILGNCITCFKVKPISSEAMMGSLPASRVNVSRPFTHCGIDYAGPVILREGKRRNSRNHKAYIAVFVCFATKAVHLEIVSDLTTDAFIASLKRLISRRDKPRCIYSDNATTFVGAQKQIKELYDWLKADQAQDSIGNFLRDSRTEWSFIPPNAPHFGGLWEAAVKSTKVHLTRIVGGAHLTFEEMNTVLCEIEAILNSRPLVPLSSDPNDMNYLSPGHFLIGEPLNSFPTTDLSDINVNTLSRKKSVLVPSLILPSPFF
ncbi:PREDICTED: uncharacterized protein LOC105558778, partial [Vollenhovia emeryi]|uniref:uncharacterized protein LOC105558778 n=1 Tax=Vollenhovia emeryi TaxID=411798 RepID=UPI0005F462D8